MGNCLLQAPKMKAGLAKGYTEQDCTAQISCTQCLLWPQARFGSRFESRYLCFIHGFGFGGAVDSRMISSGRTLNGGGISFCPRIRSSRIRAAMFPMVRKGCRMVVRLGL